MAVRLRVLISAYACEPGEGSEPGIGWNWVCQASRFHDVWVITRANNRPSIERALAKEPLPQAQFIYFDLPRWGCFWKKGRRGVHLYYYLWQMAASRLARRLHDRIRFDVAHHVTLGMYWMPSFLALLPVPFVWGPVGGGESAPISFQRSFGWRGRLYELLRDLARLRGEFDPFVRLTARSAALALATTEETEKRLQALGCRHTAVLSQVGLPDEEIHRLSRLPQRRQQPFRAASLGYLLHWKGFELALRAFAELHRARPASEFWLIGGGPEEGRLRRLARRLRVAESVRFWGPLSRPEVLSKLAECDVLVHPSLHDSGAWVCLEAMAAGLPVVCLDLGGPALLVTDRTGIKLPAVSPAQVQRDLALALIRLADQPELRAALGGAAREGVAREFRWGVKPDVWAEVCGRRLGSSIQCAC